MASEIRMPRLSDSASEAAVVTWLKKVGDAVVAGEPIAELETDKSTVDLEAPASGYLVRILVAEGSEEIPVGTLLAVLDDAAPAATASAPDGPPPPASRAPAREVSDTQPAVTQLARRMAEQAGLSLAGLPGTGPGGKIVKADVEAALDARHGGGGRASSESAPSRAEPLSRMRRTIARRLSQSKRDIPHFYLDVDCTIDRLVQARRALNERADGYKISLNDFVVRAAAVALTRVPEANASWSDDSLRVHGRVDLAVAVATDAGLVTPIVRDAQAKGLREIALETRALAERARAGRLEPRDYEGGTFTVSNLGMYGVDSVFAIINPPQACILGVGRARERPVVRDGQLAVGTVMTLCLSADHRVIDGAVGARLLDEIRSLLEDPLRMLL